MDKRQPWHINKPRSCTTNNQIYSICDFLQFSGEKLAICLRQFSEKNKESSPLSENSLYN